MFTSQTTLPVAFVENGQTDVSLTRGMLMTGLMLSVLYAVTLTSAATSIRANAVPIKSIQVLGDNNKVFHTIVPTDAVNKARIFEQTPLAAIIAPPTVTTTGTQNAEAHIPLFFRQPGINLVNAALTDLPSWAFDNLTLRINWGSVNEVFVGGVGSVAAPTGNCAVIQNQLAGIAIPNPAQYARALGLSVDRYKPVAAPAAAQTEFSIPLALTADIRALLITSEDANGELTNGIINSFTLKEDSTTVLFGALPWKSVRVDNAKRYGVTMPPGVAVLDWADDGDITDIYNHNGRRNLDLILNVTANAGTIRVLTMSIESSPLPALA